MVFSGCKPSGSPLGHIVVLVLFFEGTSMLLSIMAVSVYILINSGIEGVEGRSKREGVYVYI